MLKSCDGVAMKVADRENNGERTRWKWNERMFHFPSRLLSHFFFFVFYRSRTAIRSLFPVWAVGGGTRHWRSTLTSLDDPKSSLFMSVIRLPLSLLFFLLLHCLCHGIILGGWNNSRPTNKGQVERVCQGMSN